MQLEIVTIWSDPDEPQFKQFKLTVQNTDFKATATLHGYTDMFEKFGHELSEFPFNRKDALFESGGEGFDHYIKIYVRLADSAGRVSFAVVLRDSEGNSAQFSSIEEVAKLDILSSKLVSDQLKNSSKLSL